MPVLTPRTEKNLNDDIFVNHIVDDQIDRSHIQIKITPIGTDQSHTKRDRSQVTPKGRTTSYVQLKTQQICIIMLKEQHIAIDHIYCLHSEMLKDFSYFSRNVVFSFIFLVLQHVHQEFGRQYIPCLHMQYYSSLNII